MPKKSSKSKKDNRLSRLLSQLNPDTPKKKVAAFVVVFGILGGVYYTYQSYAAHIWIEGNSNAAAIATMEVDKNSGGDLEYVWGRAVWDMNNAETSFITPRDFALNRRACVYGKPKSHSYISVVARALESINKNKKSSGFKSKSLSKSTTTSKPKVKLTKEQIKASRAAKKQNANPINKASGAHNGHGNEVALACFDSKFSGNGKISITVNGHMELTKLVY